MAPTCPGPWGRAPTAAAPAPSVHGWPIVADRDALAGAVVTWAVSPAPRLAPSLDPADPDPQRPGGRGMGQLGPKQTPVDKQQLKKLSLAAAGLAPSSA